MGKKYEKKVIEFKDNREWKKYYNPKDIAISISLNRSNNFKNIQISSLKEKEQNKREDSYKELAELLKYSALMSDCLGINVTEIISNKIMNKQGDSSFVCKKTKKPSSRL